MTVNTAQISIMANKLYYFLYKNRFLIIYIVFGFLSLLIESICSFLLGAFLPEMITNIISISIGIFVAYFLNVNFNFKVPKQRVRLSMIYFVLVSLLSLSIQYSVGTLTNINFINNRFLLSGALFFVAYLLHRKFTFKNYRQIGIAIHLNSENNIKKIFEKVKNYPDFIHVDLIDSTYNPENVSTDLEILKEIINFWPKKKIQLHIMSQEPNYWINKVSDFQLEIFFHYKDIDEKLKSKVLNKEKFGVVIDIDTKEKDIKEASKIFNKIMILCIDRPGFSGQKFNQHINGAIDQAIKLSANNKIKITLDGGMTPELASNYNVDEIVSSSFVLTNSKSIIKILDFQTTDKYETSK